MLLLAQTKQKLGTLTFHVFLCPSVTVRPSINKFIDEIYSEYVKKSLFVTFFESTAPYMVLKQLKYK